MFDRAAKLPDNGTTWEMVSLGIIANDPMARRRKLTRRRLAAAIAGVCAATALAAWTVPQRDAHGRVVLPAPQVNGSDTPQVIDSTWD
jgi:hypothetical protein